MNDDVIQDLKQFIASTVSQQISGLRIDIHNDMAQLEQRLTAKIDDLSLAVADALDNSNEAAYLQFQNHEARITTLEQKAA